MFGIDGQKLKGRSPLLQLADFVRPPGTRRAGLRRGAAGDSGRSETAGLLCAARHCLLATCSATAGRCLAGDRDLQHGGQFI